MAFPDITASLKSAMPSLRGRLLANQSLAELTWFRVGGPAQVLFDISFAVGAGEVVTLLGRNGMGKTTTIRTLMGLLPARGGAARFEGEALLGWLNATLRIASSTEFDGNEFLRGLAKALQNLLRANSHEIAHLKMTLSPDDAFSDVAVINLVRNDGTPELSQQLPEPIESGELIVNIRAEADLVWVAKTLEK